MKKIFTLITAVIATISAWAASPELLFQGDVITNGATYQAPYDIDYIYDNNDILVMKVYEQPAFLSLKGTKGKEVTVTVTADHNISFCGLTSVCIPTLSDTKTAILGDMLVEAEDGNIVTVGLDIHGEGATAFGDFIPSTDLTVATVEVKAWYTDSPSEVSSVTVILTNKSAEELAGIADVTTDTESEITFTSGNVLNYNVANPTKLEIYSPAGALVLSRKIASVGSISLDALAPGVYIYVAGNKSGKILVR